MIGGKVVNGNGIGIIVNLNNGHTPVTAQKSQSPKAKYKKEEPTVDIQHNLPLLPSSIIAPTKDMKTFTDKN